MTFEVARRIAQLADEGFCKGIGDPTPGNMCVEAAVCYAMGLPHGDNPTCVGSAVRKFKISLNDSLWSNNIARGQGMKKLAIAQLGSDKIDQIEFSKRLVFKTITVLLAQFLYDIKFVKESEACKNAQNLEEAYAAANAATNAAYAANAASYATKATNAAANAASYSAYTASYAAKYATYTAANAAAHAANAAANAAAHAANAAAHAANDKYLELSANLALEVLQEMECEGVIYIDLVC